MLLVLKNWIRETQQRQANGSASAVATHPVSHRLERETQTENDLLHSNSSRSQRLPYKHKSLTLATSIDGPPLAISVVPKDVVVTEKRHS